MHHACTNQQKQVVHGLPIIIWGDGSTTRDYFYISDLIEALVAGAERNLHQHRIFNTGGVEEISLSQLLKLVEETVGKKAIVEYSPTRAFDAPRIILDTRLARQELGWQAMVSIKQGLAQTWDSLSSTID